MTVIVDVTVTERFKADADRLRKDFANDLRDDGYDPEKMSDTEVVRVCLDADASMDPPYFESEGGPDLDWDIRNS